MFGLFMIPLQLLPRFDHTMAGLIQTKITLHFIHSIEKYVRGVLPKKCLKLCART